MRKFFVLLIAASMAAHAATIPYQGLATDASNMPVPDKTHEFSFALYTDSTGTKELWSETQLAVTRKGLFSVELGTKTPIPEKVLRSGDPFLAVNLGDGEIKPRLRLGRVPRANHAIVADTASFASKAAGLEALVARVAAIESANAALSDRRVKDSSRIAQLERLLKGVTRTGQEIVFEGVNLNVRNGLGRTDSVNGLGNLTIGYNELRGDTSDHRTGSHMLVVGSLNSHSSYGGILVGFGNTASGRYASVSGGENNTSSGQGSSVSGGFANRASGPRSWVGGGASNHAEGGNSAVSGGSNNIADGVSSSVSGGSLNQASGSGSWIGGGSLNIAAASSSAIIGGTGNTANGGTATIVGGSNNSANGRTSTILGGLGETADGVGTTIVGGGASP